MNLHEFRSLPEDQQSALLYEEGVYVGKRKENGKAILLYQLEDFYAEIFYRNYREYICHIKCFLSTDLLHPYLKQIDVDELMKCVG